VFALKLTADTEASVEIQKLFPLLFNRVRLSKKFILGADSEKNVLIVNTSYRKRPTDRKLGLLKCHLSNAVDATECATIA